MMQNEKRALSKCMAICSRAEKCISDIQKKLDTWEINTDASQKIIKQLIEEKFIDEERFTNYYVRDKFRFNKWGKIKISFMLKGKNIPNNLIFNALDQIADEEYLSQLLSMLEYKNRSVKATTDYERKMKLSKFAQSRGFEFDVINLAISRLNFQ